MGRLEPLTSLALGRSPYDDVVPGEGEADPHEPEKQYDDTGRIVNPRSKQIIKDVIRAHNEVMLVIGVAEPENGGMNLVDLEMAEQYQEYLGDAGRASSRVGTSLGILSTWGILNIRRRILVYKKRADVSFLRLLQVEHKSHSFLQLCFAGCPCYMAMQGLRLASWFFKPYPNTISRWLHGASEYVRFHLHLFLTMQRLDMIPASHWLPGPKFFIPFSSSSPFTAPPPIESFNVSSVSRWVGKLIMNLAPYATFYLCGYIWQSTCAMFKSRIRKHLPRPLPSFPTSGRVPVTNSATQRQPAPESPVLGVADGDIRDQNLEADAQTSLALDAPPDGDAVPVRSIRRQSTFSSRGGEEYGTDEEDSEMVNPTLITFDVDTSEPNEPPSGGPWSAELRPSYSGDPRQQSKEGPIYNVNPLTTLPSAFASDILATFVTNILFIPVDSHAFPIVARALASKRGLPCDDIFHSGFLGGLTWRGVFNIIQLDVIKLLISGEIWAITTVLSQWLHVTEEEWKENQEAAGH